MGVDGKKMEPESNVLLASIENMQYAVTLDVLHMVILALSLCAESSVVTQNDINSLFPASRFLWRLGLFKRLQCLTRMVGCKH